MRADMRHTLGISASSWKVSDIVIDACSEVLMRRSVKERREESKGIEEEEN